MRRLFAIVFCLAAVGAYCQDVGFSPGGTALALVEKAIGAAKSEILVAAYEFTSRDIAEAIEGAAHRGVKVRIVADWKASQDRFSQVPVLQAAGIPVRLDRLYAIMHNKFLVIDGDSVETGSFQLHDGRGQAQRGERPGALECPAARRAVRRGVGKTLDGVEVAMSDNCPLSVKRGSPSNPGT